MTNRRFTVDPKRVVHETIEGETILISLENGIYYSLRGSGPEVWGLVLAGLSEDEVVAEMRDRHTEDATVVAELTRELVDELIREELIVETGSSGNGRIPPAPPAAGPPGSFSAPVLQRYTDMEFFLQLDPVHDMDAAGWPHERQEAATE